MVININENDYLESTEYHKVLYYLDKKLYNDELVIPCIV